MSSVCMKQRGVETESLIFCFKLAKFCTEDDQHIIYE